MLSKHKLPKKLRTIHHPGRTLEIWINDKKVTRLIDLTKAEQKFLVHFISNLEDLGWTVLAN